jgi:hypothetical protein
MSSTIDRLSPAEAKIRLFRAPFRGREDIYARRFESREQGLYQWTTLVRAASARTSSLFERGVRRWSSPNATNAWTYSEMPSEAISQRQNKIRQFRRSTTRMRIDHVAPRGPIRSIRPGAAPSMKSMRWVGGFFSSASTAV